MSSIVIDLGGTFAGEGLYRDLKRFAQSAAVHDRIAPERKLAAQYEISYSTVRRIMARLVKEGMLYRVQGRGTFVAKQSDRNAPLGVVLYLIEGWKDFCHPYCAREMQGITDGAQAHGWRVQVHQGVNTKDPGEVRRLRTEVERPEVVGLLLSRLSPRLDGSCKPNKPMVKFGPIREANHPADVPCIMTDRFQISYLAVEYLLRNNLSSLLLAYNDELYLQGARAALANARSRPEALFISCGDPQAASALAGQILREKPQALAFMDDRLALRTYQVLLRRDPGYLDRTRLISLSNAGEDYLPAEFAQVEVDGYPVGSTAVSLLYALMKGHPIEQNVVQIMPRLIEPAPGETQSPSAALSVLSG